MKLIDKNKLIDAVIERHYSHASMRLIREQPEVEAIPIEWLKSKIDAILDNYPDGNEETEILCKLLYEWEKENETN